MKEHRHELAGLLLHDAVLAVGRAIGKLVLIHQPPDYTSDHYQPPIDAISHELPDDQP